ncbi:hypothetical protein [Mycobacteroides abscessus]|uniref:hypothetical protein n=1 Tax=Mycobacteroides abscessus TaxID=36809 RepID=UPI0019D1A045|nr:hypothetical protein [Mycobacteroides abscessus]MBN7517064.1 hypothetical protein [Mycobacteroides abscessus subsp. abscessus]
MTDTLVRGIGEKTVVTKTTYSGGVSETSYRHLVLEVGKEVLATSAPHHEDHTASGEWLVSIAVSPNEFWVRNREEAIDALDDIGRFYLAVKAGEV